MKAKTSAALSAGVAYLYWGAAKIKDKSDESGLSQKLSNAKEYSK